VHCNVQRQLPFHLSKQLLHDSGAVVQVHAAAVILQLQHRSAELEQLLAAARAAAVQHALAEHRTSDAEIAICRSVADMCATCATPVDTTVRPVLPSALCGLQACCRAAREAFGVASLTRTLQLAPSCRRAAPQVQAMAPVGDGSRIVDNLLTWPSGKVAVEVDGPSHCLRDASGARTILNTPTRMRNHILEQWGYTAVSVRLEDSPFESLESDEFRQALAACLQAAGVPLPPRISAASRTWAWPRAA
jgi:hypothetical protein